MKIKMVKLVSNTKGSYSANTSCFQVKNKLAILVAFFRSSHEAELVLRTD